MMKSRVKWFNDAKGYGFTDKGYQAKNVFLVTDGINVM